MSAAQLILTEAPAANDHGIVSGTARRVAIHTGGGNLQRK